MREWYVVWVRFDEAWRREKLGAGREYLVRAKAPNDLTLTEDPQKAFKFGTMAEARAVAKSLGHSQAVRFSTALMRWEESRPADPNDPYGPPAVPVLVKCLHCEEEFLSDKLKWASGCWCCPTPGCDGAGLGFDIYPVQSDEKEPKDASGRDASEGATIAPGAEAAGGASLPGVRPPTDGRVYSAADRGRSDQSDGSARDGSEGAGNV